MLITVRDLHCANIYLSKENDAQGMRVVCDLGFGLAK